MTNHDNEPAHQAEQSKDDEPAVRRLTPDELTELRRDMAEASAWMRAELARRRAAKEQS